MTRRITSHQVNGCNESLDILVTDEKGPGGANHDYDIHLLADPSPETPKITGEIWTFKIRFQKGPIKEAGVNGVTQEALLAIVADRLEGFQSGQYACDENARALAYVQKAMSILKLRTERRVARNVEGTNQV